jgi:CRP-like cAMP-binding protein
VQNSNIVSKNRLLAGLGASDLDRLRPHLKHVHLARGHVLHAPRGPIAQVYFPESGMVSMLTVMMAGEQIETAIIGREGVVGARVAVFGETANTQSTVQIESSGWQLPVTNFLELYQQSDSFRSAINAHLGLILFQAQQSAACHAIHSVESRLCRWLLLSSDMMESDHVSLTQEFLSHMLGVQRTSVSMAAHTLQKAGLIEYARGKIKIVDRKAIEDCACECYAVIREQIDQLRRAGPTDGRQREPLAPPRRPT